MNRAEKCGVCYVPVPIDHAQIGRWEADGSITPYHMRCEGAAVKLAPCQRCGKHRKVCDDCAKEGKHAEPKKP